MQSVIRAVVALATCMLAASGASSAPTPPATYANPVLFADYSDPDVIRSGSDYYLVASSFHMSPGLPVLRSHDLVNWTIVGHVLPRLPFAPQYDLPGPFKITDAKPYPTAGTRYGGGPWAPSIREHAGKFFVYWPTPDEGIFMATAKRPEGPWSAPVKVIAQPGLEDPCPLWDDDGTAWLVHGKVGAGPLVLHRMSEDGTRVLDAGTVIAADKQRLPVLEGPKLYKRNGWYYIFAPIGGVATGPEVVGRARDIRGPYEWRDVLLPGGPLGLKGPHQGGWVETPTGQGWFLHFNAAGAFGRILYLEPLRWTDDWPVIGGADPGETAGHPVARAPYPAGVRSTSDRLQTSDEFTSSRLGPQWEWNHNPDDTAWSLSARRGFLRLRATHADHLVTARNTLTQVLEGPASTYTARVDLSGMAEGQRTGLTLFNAQPSWVGVVRGPAGSHVVVAEAGDERVVGDAPGGWIEFRARVSADQKVAYSYSLDDGRTFVAAGQPIALARYAWWKGSRPGLFTFNSETARGRVDVDWFRVTRPSAASSPDS